jgi:hypothetical protein
MSNGKIELSYHPALKEMKFRRWENEVWTEVDLSKSKKLFNYSIKKEKEGIILQNLGREFFNDLANSMDGIKKITVDFNGTELDNGDFKNMIEDFNKQNKEINFSVGKFTELNDMESLYEDIKLFSDETIETLKSTLTKEVLVNIKDEIERQIIEIEKKKKKLDNNTVNLCFVGAYSSGKSTLINAILGFKILPEAAISETGRMFMITHVKNPEDGSIFFLIGTKDGNKPVVLRWNEASKTFSFYTEIQESEIRKTIQECINENNNKFLHTQLYNILSIINKQPNCPYGNNPEKFYEYIPGIINVSFPIPLCNGINFTIYDTPGTDSNYSEHLSILKTALEEQTNSILIFVNHPNKSEGTGNSLLIKLLDHIEKNASKSTIDVGRSLFVINFADIIGVDKDFIDLKNKPLIWTPSSQEDGCETREVTLINKRLFFTSATAAYIAKATKNEKLSDEDTAKKKQMGIFYNPKDPVFEYYKHNHMALSEYITEQVQSEAKEEAKRAGNNDEDLINVNSGLYTLEREIKKYGSKFALAVKAKSIIDAVQFVIDHFDTKTKSLEEAKKSTKEKLKNDIITLEKDLINQINNARNKFKEKEKNEEKNVLSRLELTDAANYKLQNFIDKEVSEIWVVGEGTLIKKTKEALENFLKEFLKLKIDVKDETSKKTWTKKSSMKALDNLNVFLNDFYNSYRKNSNIVIKEKINSFNKSIMDIIKECKIDDTSKERLLHIEEVKLDDPPSISDKVQDVEIFMRSYFIIKKLNKERYAEAISKEASILINQAREKFTKDYEDRLQEKCKELTEKYIKNIKNYSGELRRLLDDKIAVEKELEQLKIILDEIKEKRENLFKKIWGEKNV